MKTTYDKGLLKIDLVPLLESMIEEDKLHIIEMLACQSEVIKYVTAQILDGCTENGSYGSLNFTASAAPQWGLDWAKRQVALRAGECATEEIRRLVSALESKDRELAGLRNLLSEERTRHERNY